MQEPGQKLLGPPSMQGKSSCEDMSKGQKNETPQTGYTGKSLIKYVTIVSVIITIYRIAST